MIRRTSLKRSNKSIKRSPIKKARSKPRPGRLEGAALTKLREEVFDRDGYRCQHIWLGMRCLRLLTWNTAHMAHIRNKRMWGDSLDNCTTKCAEHHLVNEHSYGPSGEKPCKKKEHS